MLTVTIHRSKKFVSQTDHMVRVSSKFKLCWSRCNLYEPLDSSPFLPAILLHLWLSPTKPFQKIKFLFLLDPPGTFTSICKRKNISLLINKFLVEITHPNQTTLWNSLFVTTIGVQKLSSDSRGQPQTRDAWEANILNLAIIRVEKQKFNKWAL